MKLHRFLLAAAVLLLAALPALAAVTPGAPAASAQAGPAQLASPAALGDFLASLAQPAPQLAATCGSSFCTQAERDACNKKCQGHGVFVGLECCSSTCTTYCICGSRPIGC